MSWKLGFIGGGVMAEVMIAGLLEEGVLGPERILVSNRRPPRAEELHERFGVVAGEDNNRDVAAQCDVIVLSVKPQTLPTVLRELSGLKP